MKISHTAQFLGLVLLAAVLSQAATSWHVARIVSVNNTTETRNTVWVVNTPVVDEKQVCTLTVHVRDKIVTASYEPDESRPAAPKEWTKNKAVLAQVVGDYLYVRSSSSDEVRARISKTKPAPPVQPWTPEETETLKTALAGTPEQDPESMIGFDAPAKPASAAQPAAAAPVPQAAPAPSPEPTMGTVKVSSVPFLAEVFVDGESVGYTPAKVALAPGKHSFRCEKSGYTPWTKEITITAGSELTLDATLILNKK